jgi:hypothetical protein
MLLIAGPSGGGKSTLIRLLAAKSLAPEILALLPADCAHWPIIEANNLLKGDLTKESLLHHHGQADGWILHYDINFIHCHGVNHYADDPAMELLAAANPLGVVFVRPAREMLHAQFLTRQSRHHHSKSKASLLWARFFRRPLRRALNACSGKRPVSTAELYRQEAWLNACYAQWESFIRGAVKQHPNARILVVEPISAPSTAPSFRLATSPLN